MDTIFLTGFMGAGKTTVGQVLARRLSMAVFDTDEMIEELCRKKITDIFAEEGEAAFRDHEMKVLKKVSWPGVIVTTGGGTVIKPENRQFMRECGVVIYLHSDPDTILKRLNGDGSRPLLNDHKATQIHKLMKKRMPLYLEADYAVNTSMKSIDTIVEEITGFLSRDHRFWA